jgi:hypothetical protein
MLKIQKIFGICIKPKEIIDGTNTSHLTDHTYLNSSLIEIVT